MALTAIIGVGAMGEALLAGLLRAGTPASEVIVGGASERTARRIEDRYGVSTDDHVAAVTAADVVAVVVKPKDLDDVLQRIAPASGPGKLVVSLVAGVTTSYLESRLAVGTSVVRVMPNTPALVGLGMSALTGGRSCTQRDVARATLMMSSVGRVVTVPEEAQDTVTALSGSGPAYFFLLAEVMIEAGVHIGLDRQTSETLAVRAFAEAASECSAGTTRWAAVQEGLHAPEVAIAGIRELERLGVRAAFLDAVEAARDRSMAMGEPDVRSRADATHCSNTRPVERAE